VTSPGTDGRDEADRGEATDWSCRPAGGWAVYRALRERFLRQARGDGETRGDDARPAREVDDDPRTP
jgi:hypothetical protein